MKTALKYFLLLLACLTLVACQGSKVSSPKASSSESVASMSSAMSQKDQETIEEAGDLTPEEVAAAEGNDSEQVVVAITADGYATSHGDHYHFYNGSVGYEALWSKDLLVPDGYVFDPAHVVSDLTDGHVVKVGEDYYIYTTQDPPQNARD